MGKPLRAFLAVAALIITSSAIAIACTPKVVAVQPAGDSIPPPVSPAMNAWLANLQAHENCPPEGIIDSNGLRSYGPFCYQAATFARYMKIFGLPTAPIWDPATQRELTIRILETYPGGWSNWANSVAKIGKPPVVPPMSKTGL